MRDEIKRERDKRPPLPHGTVSTMSSDDGTSCRAASRRKSRDYPGVLDIEARPGTKQSSQ